MRGLDVFATLLAIAGVAFAVEAWLAGSLFRYVLAGLVGGALLCVPLLSIALLRDRARRVFRLVLFALAPLLALLLLVEIGIRVLGPTDEGKEVLVADARLGHVNLPGVGGMDSWGFRNAAVPERVDALFVGDSQTWGFFLDREEAFPTLFGESTGLSTYQMSNGAYGPVHYRELLRRGLELRPQLVVVGFYFGNDLWDAAAGAGLVSGADVRDPKRTYEPPHNPEIEEGEAAPNWIMACADHAQRSSRLLGWAGEVVKSRLRGSAMLDDQPGAVPFDGGAVSTLLLPEYRRAALDLGSSSIADGLRIAEQCLRDIAARCRDAGAHCVLLAIPTKEYCYAEWQRREGAPLPELAGLHAAESAVRERVFAAAAAAELEVVDLAPVCIAALAAGEPIWAGNGDGHLMRGGHAAAAAALAEIWPR